MEMYDLISKIEDDKEKFEVIDELKKINRFKLDCEINNLNEKEANDFIHSIINKYRNKSEVSEFYNSSGGDKLSINYYDNLCSIESMILNYVAKKVLKEKFNGILMNNKII